MKLGILRRLQIGMMGFGIAMGLIFPVYAMFFVEFKPGIQI
jgi:methyl-accepting chemotaxis protein